LWIHADEPEDLFRLQGIFGLHPLSVEAVTHQNQPSKIEEYDEYLFTIIDGVSYDEIKIGEKQKSNKTEDDKYDLHLIEDDLYIFFEGRWIVTINFHNQKFQENIRRRIKNLQQHTLKSADSKQQPSNEDGKRNRETTHQICEIIYCLAIEESIASYYPVIGLEEKLVFWSVDEMKIGNLSFFKRDAQIGEISSNVSCSGKDSGEFNRSCGFAF
jgi:hypothetical protein